MGLRSIIASAALVASAAAQVATFSDGSSGRSLAVNVPDATAKSGSGPIYFQITAPGGTQWLAFGTGTAMSNSNMFVIYASGNTPVLSPRKTTGHNTPQFDSSIQASIQDGSGVKSDGSIVVNVKCDNCLSWSGGSMSPTSSSSNWIMAYKSGSALGSTDQSASISRHDSHSSFTLDLTAGVGGSSTGPFSSASSSSASASGTGTATATGTASASASASGTNSVSQPLASQNPNSASSSTTTTSSDNTDMLRSAHGIIMSVLFLACFPFFALTLYLPTANKVRYIHAPLQTLSVVLLIVAMALGIVLGKQLDELDTYHQIIGFIVVFVLVLVQPAMGIVQHLHFHKTGGRSMWGPLHQGIGRGMLILGIINGGLGWNQAENSGAYVPYAVVSVLVAVIYVLVVLWFTFRSKGRSMPIDQETKSPNGYEMQSNHRRLDSENVQQTSIEPKHN